MTVKIFNLIDLILDYNKISMYITVAEKQTELHIDHVSKHVPTFFCSMSVKYERISTKIGRHVVKETLNETMQKVPTSPIMCASTTLGNLK